MSNSNNDLSDREQEILALLATGASNKEIAAQLFISVNTVKVHLRNIFSKLEVSSRTEAAMYAVNSGIVQTDSSQESGNKELEAYPNSKNGGVIVTRIFGISISQSIIFWTLGLILALTLIAGGVFLGMRNLLPPQTEISYSQPAVTPDLPRWQILSDIPTARFGLAVAGYENKIYAIGGMTSSGVTNVVERYDLDNNTWTTVSPKITPVYNANAVVLGGKIYIPGGKLESGQNINNLEIYDLRRDQWELGAALPVGLSAYAMTTFEGRLYLFGGWDGHNFVNSVFVYDPVQDKWSSNTPMPTARGYHGAAVAQGKVYVIGGYDGIDSLNTTEIYQPDIDNGINQPWDIGPSLPVGRYRMGVVSIADFVLVFGGVEGDEKSPVSLKYSPWQDEWQIFESLSPHVWSDLGVVTLGTHVYILGGKQNERPSNATLSYQAIYILAIPVAPVE